MRTLPAKNTLDQAFDPEQFRFLAHQLVDQLADHLKAHQTGQTNVLPYASPAEQLEFWQQHFQQENGLDDTFTAILDRSIGVHNPRYLGHQVSTVAPIASIAGMMVDLLSNGMGVYEMGMAGNAIERVIIDFMNQAVGYPAEAGGFMTSGGTLANLTGLLAARKANAPTDVWQDGSQEKLAIMVSESAHYSVDRAARVMGLGSEGIIKVPMDERFKMRTDLLAASLAQAKADGFHVFAVVGCASSTATGSFDDLEAIADFCEANKLWFHLDGAHGGGVVFSDQYKHLAKGSHRADSILIDFHKMLLTPALATALLFKNNSDSYKTFAQQAEYLWDTPQEEEWYNSGKRTFECTKLMMGVKVYSILKAHGKEIFQQNIDRLFGLARNFAQQIESREEFELLLSPEANIVNFRYIGGPADDLDSLNEQIRQSLLESGKFYIVSTLIHGKRYLRSAIMNPLTTGDDFQALLDEIETIGRKLGSENC